jgi:phage/plasmid-associated DNA primase
MLAGCREWQRAGLADLPPAITQATEDYQKESDTIRQFVFDMCVSGQAEYSVKASELYAKYKEWAFAQGFKNVDILTNTAFGTSLTQSSKYTKKHHRDGWYYQGLRIRQLDDPLPDLEEVQTVTPNSVMSSAVTGFLRLCDGLKGLSGLIQNSNSRMESNGENPSQPVTEANNPSPSNVTGSVTGLANLSQPQKATEETLSLEEARKMVEGL